MSPAAPRRLPFEPVCSATLLEPKRLTRSPAAPNRLLSDEKAIELGA